MRHQAERRVRALRDCNSRRQCVRSTLERRSFSSTKGNLTRLTSLTDLTDLTGQNYFRWREIGIIFYIFIFYMGYRRSLETTFRLKGEVIAPLDSGSGGMRPSNGAKWKEDTDRPMSVRLGQRQEVGCRQMTKRSHQPLEHETPVHSSETPELVPFQRSDLDSNS